MSYYPKNDFQISVSSVQAHAKIKNCFLLNVLGSEEASWAIDDRARSNLWIKTQSNKKWN